MEIAIIGGGNGAYAAAADLTEKGHNVRLWRRNVEAFGSLLNTRTMKVKDIDGVREVRLSVVSSDLQAVVTGARLLVIPLPATAQASIAKELSPYLQNGQVIYLPPGTFGSYLMSNVLHEAGCTAEVTFAETGTLPYLARKHGADTVSISGRATRLPTGVFPSSRSAYAFSVLQEAFPVIEPIRDVLDGALMNAGPIIHPPLILMNAGAIEHFNRWDIHGEGTQPAIRRVHNALDGERIAVREKLGYRAPHFPLADHYNTTEGDEWMYGLAAHQKLVDSADWHESLDLYTHRYMREDIACGLALLVSLAEWADVKAPIASGLLAVASAVISEDLRLIGRTLENMKLRHLSIKEMKVMLEHGIGVTA
ncbi:NAD/NADP-dependent octopine/nopaline dehydrogenase family protein [Aneurinibacillus aneurinilyticus]|uniref:NAD-dependent glycerol-3-phosphate dehydrogenase [NAD(P)+ ] n=1 Tax=Aneurinibacillus aneurinilyticus ATCC 12856 TaxID=649747 RepID=U1WPB7_ANEAE|nr:NAD/NADP-dependent octopine/nopaline dehydrogenase family protein [Aneurinibacillus aneurinilyticus]ERI10444.1 NAD-dependent glycerol-3-phosphate dehydrogenase [NAD(P)+ ] [Aneurinibacillus aneurinilyticus ATCC 12856]MED0709012.1 NAD/NADP octopine/nopaline dehydrogenase family protein [Aneurinibacillus aneurinilyticus]MED0725406.1 NAD/NADP octopine/nopaline dehydrogenase family protein [Aneurinibacillus aneurinilyticus]MED0730717.1 NAD/NADP octopine/nopaline dehydrogenase family protein [Aneu